MLTTWQHLTHFLLEWKHTLVYGDEQMSHKMVLLTIDIAHEWLARGQFYHVKLMKYGANGTNATAVNFKLNNNNEWNKNFVQPDLFGLIFLSLAKRFDETY